MKISCAKELTVYQKAYTLAMEIYHLSKSFPVEERYALVSQIRRSSRSVCTNLREAWAKRRYEAHFTSKLTDCDGEINETDTALVNETDTALDFARDCGFLGTEEYARLVAVCTEVRRMLGAMLTNTAPFLITDG